MSAKKKKKLYEGSTKDVYETEAPDQLLLTFKDTVRGTNATIENKGVINCRVSVLLFRFLSSYNVATHFVAENGVDTIVVRRLDMLPLQAVIHNFANAALAKQLQVKNGEALNKPHVELLRKDSPGHVSPLSEEEIRTAQLLSVDELRSLNRLVTKGNAVLRAFFDRRGLALASARFEFGRSKTRIVIADEVSFDTCNLWEKGTGERFDFDNTRNDVAAMKVVFQEVSRRVLTKA